MKNLIHGYLTAPSRKKGEVLRLIANILGFSEEDVVQVGLATAKQSIKTWAGLLAFWYIHTYIHAYLKSWNRTVKVYYNCLGLLIADPVGVVS